MRTSTAVSAGGVIADDRGQIVLTGRRSFKGDLHWGLPKGGVEQSEAIAEAALREAREETGFEVEVVGELPTIDYWFVQPAADGQPAVRVHKFVHFFLMRITGGDPSLHDAETEQVVILDPGEAIDLATFDSEKRLIEAAAELLGPRAVKE